MANLSSLGIRHVFFIIKENRTYDQVLGDIGKGNSDPKLCVYGRDVTPNHHALAERYVLLDNFHTGGAISFDGHQWLMQAFVSDYVERAFAASPRGYAWNMSDALTVSPAGFFWQSAQAAPGCPDLRRIQPAGALGSRTQNIVDMNEREELSWADYWKPIRKGSGKAWWASAAACRRSRRS